MNLQEFRRTYSTEQILKMAESENYIFPDQDVLNKLCEGRVCYLDGSWNTMMNHENEEISRLKVAKMAPRSIYQDYIEARKHPRIVHYAGYQKPWVYIDCDMAEYFWQYARETIFWEDLLLHKIQRIEEPENAQTLTYINSVAEPIFLDGTMVKLIGFINKWFPIGSTRRNVIKKVAAVFFN